MMYETVRLALEMTRNYNQSKEVPMGAQPQKRKDVVDAPSVTRAADFAA